MQWSQKEKLTVRHSLVRGVRSGGAERALRKTWAAELLEGHPGGCAEMPTKTPTGSCCLRASRACWEATTWR